MTYKTNEPPVRYEQAVERVKSAPPGTKLLASHIGNLIWPGHRMTAQGAALAAAPFIRSMRKDGILDIGRRGWIVTHNAAVTGLAPAQEVEK